MQGDDVGGAQDVVEVARAAAHGEDLHVESHGAARDRGSDAAQSDDAERGPAHLASGYESAPASRADEPVAGGHAAPRREHERHREVGGGPVEHARRVGDGDAPLVRGGDVDAVVADAVVRDQPQGRVQGEVDGLVHDDEDVDVGPRRIRGRDLDAAELAPRRAGERLGRPHLHRCHATTLSV